MGVAPAVWMPLAIFQGLWCVGETIFVSRYRSSAALSPRTSRDSIVPVAAGIVALLIVLISTAECFVALNRTLPMVVFAGFAVGCVGVALRMIAIRKLGPRFLDHIALLPRHQIESSGIYRWMKHPAELGFCLAILGYAAMCRSIFGLSLVLMAQVPISLLRVRTENRLLAKNCL